MKRGFVLYSDMNTEESLSKKVALVERNPAPNGIPLVSTVAIAKKGSNDLVELAMEIQKADEFVNATACNKLQVIAEQVRFLQGQAQKVLLEAKTNSMLHHAACNFKKVPGKTYYLYRRPSGQEFFSMLSPQEWKTSHQFLGGFRLEADHSWTPESEISQKDTNNTLINKIMAAKDQIPLLELQQSPMEM